MAVSIKVSGVEYSGLTDYSIDQQTGGVSSSTVTIACDDEHPVPAVKAGVQILLDDTPIFYGIIDNVESPTFGKEYSKTLYRLSISSAESFFANRYPSEAYESKYTHEIVQDLFTKYIETEGITLGSISEFEQMYENFNFSFTQLSQIINELADDVNAACYISPDKKFYFYSRNDFPEVELPELKNLRLKSESGELRTRQIITGAKEETAEQTEYTVWLEDQTIMPLGYQISYIDTVSINDTPVGVGFAGLDEEDTSKTFLYTVGSQQLTLNSNALVKPVATDVIECIYYGYYEVVIENSNDQMQNQIAELNGSSGIIENVYTDETIDNQADAETKAAALLDLYGDSEQVISCECHDMIASQLLNMWTFPYSDYGITGKYVVTERHITSFGADAFLCSITLNSKNFMRRYGSVLNKKKKSVNKDIKIYKKTTVSDPVTASETVTINNTTLTCFPIVRGDGRLYNSGLPGMYPI